MAVVYAALQLQLSNEWCCAAAAADVAGVLHQTPAETALELLGGQSGRVHSSLGVANLWQQLQLLQPCPQPSVELPAAVAGLGRGPLVNARVCSQTAGVAARLQDQDVCSECDRSSICE